MVRWSVVAMAVFIMAVTSSLLVLVHGQTFHFDAQRSGNFEDEGPENANLVHSIFLGGFIDGSPVVFDDSIYVFNSPGFSANEKLGLYNVSLDDGESIGWFVPGIYSMSTPAVAEDGLIVHAYNESSGEEVLGYYYFNGSLNWEVTIRNGEYLNYWNVISSPLILNQNERIVVISYDGVLRCFGNDGIELWNTTGISEGPLRKCPSPSASIDEDFVFFPINESGLYYLASVDKDGIFQWKYPLEGEVTGTPVVGRNDGDVFVIVTTDKMLYRIEDGVEIWNTSFLGDFSSPALAGDSLFLGSSAGKFYCLNTSDGKEVWNFTAIDNPMPWESIKSSPAYSNGVVYFGTNEAEGKIFALNSSTGELNWVYGVGQYIMSSPFVYKNKLVIGADDGNIYIIGLWNGDVKLKPVKKEIMLKDGTLKSINGTSALAALYRASENSGFSVDIVDSSFGLYVESIGGIEPQGWDKGWMYQVNGISPSVGAAEYDLSDGDVVKFYYGSWDISGRPEEADYRVIIDVETIYDIWEGSIDIVGGNFTIETGDNSYEIDNFTVLGALNIASKNGGFEFSVSDSYYDSYGLFVDSIFGLENEGYSGWMFWVNYPEEMVSWESADKYKLKEGDTVYWYYSNSFESTPENSPNIKIEISHKEVNISSFTVESGVNRGDEVLAWVNLTSYEQGWYVIVVSGLNEGGDSVAGVSTAYLDNSGGSKEFPVLIHIPAQVSAGNYTLYTGIYRYEDFPENILLFSEGIDCEVS